MLCRHRSIVSDQRYIQQLLREAEDSLSVRDARRLQGKARKLRGGNSQPLIKELNAARQRTEQRLRRMPGNLNYPPELPVVAARDELLAAIRAHQVIVVCGDTGSGKSTQLPKLCLRPAAAGAG